MTIHRDVSLADDAHREPPVHLDTPRMKRELPLREQPKRSAVHAFRSAQREPELAVRGAAEPRVPGPLAAVASATENAYRVIEEYLSQGQRTAAQRNAQRDWRTAMAPRNNFGQGGAQWLHLWQDMAQQWTQAMTQFVPGAASMMPFVPQPTPQPYVPAVQAREVEIELDTAQRTHVQLQFVSRSHVGPLKVTLAQVDGTGRLALEFDAKHVRLRIPTGTAAGTYSGVVFDSHNTQVGMLTIKVSAPSSAH